MKQLEYAFSIIVPVVTALLLITLGVIAAEIIIQFNHSYAGDKVLQLVSNPTENGIWAITGAVIGSLFSIVFLAAWETYKSYRYDKKLDKAIIISLREELQNCSQHIQSCTHQLQAELEAISKTPKATLVAPPPLIQLNIWELLRMHIPKAIASHNSLLADLRSASNYAIAFNAQLDSREQYHINCKTITNFYDQMKIFDTHMLEILPQINEHVKSISTELNNIG